MYTDKPVVLFDGICNYCNSWVNFAIRHDKKGRLKFAALQSGSGEELRQYHKIPPETDSVIFIDRDKVYTYSDAALQISKWLDWPARAISALLIIPKFIRQPIYKWIAKNRYKWFGKKETCMIPGPAIKERFLS